MTNEYLKSKLDETAISYTPAEMRTVVDVEERKDNLIDFIQSLDLDDCRFATDSAITAMADYVEDPSGKIVDTMIETIRAKIEIDKLIKSLKQAKADLDHATEQLEGMYHKQNHMTKKVEHIGKRVAPLAM